MTITLTRTIAMHRFIMMLMVMIRMATTITLITAALP